MTATALTGHSCQPCQQPAGRPALTASAAPTATGALDEQFAAGLRRDSDQILRAVARAEQSVLRTVARELRYEMHRRPAARPAARPKTARAAQAGPVIRAAVSSDTGADRAALDHLRGFWSALNDQHFGGALSAPVIELAEDLPGDVYGDFLPRDGGAPTIRLDRGLLVGSHPDVRAGDAYAAGRLLLVEDVAAHEIAHQAQIELERAPEMHWRGHGPVFASLCNRLGRGANLRETSTGDWEAWQSWPFAQRWPAAYAGAFTVTVGAERSRAA